MRNTSLVLVMLFVCTIFNSNVSAQEVAVSLNVATEGTLSTLINPSKKDLITNLTLTGRLNGSDISFIREMAGRSFGGDQTSGLLKKLDISGATICGGEAAYYTTGRDRFSTTNNTIGDYMFYNCSGLTSITLPNSVTSIGNYAFSSCTSLTSMSIPNSVTSIGDYAFYCCISLTSIAIPNSVKSIGYRALSNCISITSISIPNSVTSIGKESFQLCTGLTSLTFPNSVTSIADNAFYGCTGLSSLTIPNGVTSIGYNAFGSCTGLTSIIISNSVTSIGDRAFSNCTGLTSISIPKSVTSIGNEAFGNLKNNKTIIVDGDNKYFCSIDGVLFDKLGTTILVFPNAKSATYAIPNSVTSIGNDAFSYCKSLTSITIPNNVTLIDYFAFYSCSGLTSITIPNSVTTIRDYAFSSCTGLKEIHCQRMTPVTVSSNVFGEVNKSVCKLYVPKGSYSSYWISNVWGDFANIIEEEPTSTIQTKSSNEIVFSDQDAIVVKGIIPGNTIRIYSIMGQLIHTSTALDTESRIKVIKGQNYIVKVADKVYKVAL